ncbi:hypothetical protein TIFTF001_017989 [Ficus carica]|uniref:Bifunctional inhibitor/plant lipid transfer protein/seed storage helical domain-containing protein n=1 Tax=Ficus carica TaxID=3494 RepID=A0AA88AAB3_FICCA|nr:hypothetical protein TIFTF001_017989 [Ficus carica]
MEGIKAFKSIAMSAYIVVVVSVISVDSQIFTVPCTTSMVSTFTPCLNFVTGSSNNGSMPSIGCCGSLKSIVSTSVDCACLLITANVPIPLPINRTLLLSLPQVCNINNVPLQCKSAGSPLPASAPTLLGPTFPPTTAASPFSPQASNEVDTDPATESETTNEQLTPTISPAVESEGPSRTMNAEIRRVLKSPTSGSSPSYVFPSILMQTIICIVFFMISI